MLLPQLKRLRWAVRLVLTLGVAASVAANILHALPNPISQSIAAWPPLALLLTVELTSRIPIHKRSLTAVRVLATASIAGIAAWVSYWHMQGVADKYGEGSNSYLIPITVDGLIVVASVSLVELAGRIRSLETPAESPAIPTQQSAAIVEEVRVAPAPAVAPVSPAPVQSETNARATAGSRRRRPSGLSGIQTEEPSRPGLSGKPLMQEPPYSR